MLMQTLLDEMLQSGADIRNIRASIFGGSQNHISGFGVGDQNAEYAIDFLNRNRIPIVDIDVGGKQGRTIRFFPTTGQVVHRKIRPEAVILADQNGA